MWLWAEGLLRKNAKTGFLVLLHAHSLLGSMITIGMPKYGDSNTSHFNHISAILVKHLYRCLIFDH